jgi:cytochrome c-type biogenesis protein
MGSLTLAFLAGLVSILSPCVLPLLPIVLATAVSKHRLGPLALAAGLAISFVVIGLFIALIGFAIGLDARIFRFIAAILLVTIGVLLILPAAQTRFATSLGPLSGWAEARTGRFDDAGLAGQFAIGLLLGVIWTPCVGPTLGAASILAARGENLAHVFLIMTTFGLGAALPLLALGTLSRGLILRLRDRMLATGRHGKMLLGAILIGLGVLILSGLDKRLEAYLVAVSPPWLTELTTRY